MDKNLFNNFKILMAILREVPLCIAIFTFVSIIIQFFGYYFIGLNYLASLSFLIAILLLGASYIFKFCYYHRIGLYYATIAQSLCIIDKYIGLPVDLVELFVIHILLFLWLVISLLYFKLK